MKTATKLNSSQRYRQTATHEAGHAIGFFAAGVRVEELRTSSNGGHCRPERVPESEAMIVALLCGPLAVEYAHGDAAGPSAELSDADHSLLRAAEQDVIEASGLGSPASLRNGWRDRAWLLLHNHRGALLSLADHLDRVGEMDRLAIAAFIHRPDSGLGEFRHVYPRSSEPSPSTAATSSRALTATGSRGKRSSVLVLRLY